MNGPTGLFLHSNCALDLYRKEKLEKAKRRRDKTEQERSDENVEKHEHEPSDEPFMKRPRRSTTGIIHDKDLCVLCMQGKDDKHKDGGKSNSFIISTFAVFR